MGIEAKNRFLFTSTLEENRRFSKMPIQSTSGNYGVLFLWQNVDMTTIKRCHEKNREDTGTVRPRTQQREDPQQQREDQAEAKENRPKPCLEQNPVAYYRTHNTLVGRNQQSSG